MGGLNSKPVVLWISIHGSLGGYDSDFERFSLKEGSELTILGSAPIGETCYYPRSSNLVIPEIQELLKTSTDEHSIYSDILKLLKNINWEPFIKGIQDEGEKQKVHTFSNNDQRWSEFSYRSDMEPGPINKFFGVSEHELKNRELFKLELITDRGTIDLFDRVTYTIMNMVFKLVECIE
jgi:hypothetical protein